MARNSTKSEVLSGMDNIYLYLTHSICTTLRGICSATEYDFRLTSHLVKIYYEKGQKPLKKSLKNLERLLKKTPKISTSHDYFQEDVSVLLKVQPDFILKEMYVFVAKESSVAEVPNTFLNSYPNIHFSKGDFS